MQFEHTHVLFLLLAIPALLAIYARYNSGKKLAVLKFSSLDIVTRASSKGIFARQHAPFVLITAAICMSVLALADLQVPSTHTDLTMMNGKNIGIVLDVSESMAASDYEPSRLEAAKQSIVRLIQMSSPHDYIGVIIFETGATTISYMTHDRQATSNAIMAIGNAGGATAIGDGLALGVDMVRSIPDRDKVIILLSDGSDNSGRIIPDEAAAYAYENGVQVHTIGIGSAEPVFLKEDVFGEPQYAHLDEGLLRHIANVTGGTYSKSLGNEMLGAILAGIGSELEYKITHQSVSHWFTITALLLLAATAYIIYCKYRIVA